MNEQKRKKKLSTYLANKFTSYEGKKQQPKKLSFAAEEKLCKKSLIYECKTFVVVF